MASLELCFNPTDAAQVLRLPAITRRSGRPVTIDRVWHDTADGALAADGLSLSTDKSGWRLEACRPLPGHSWPPATPAPLIEMAPGLDAFKYPLPGPLMPIAGMRAQQREARFDDGAGPVNLILLDGTLRGLTQERAIGRLILTGEASQLLALSVTIGAAIRVTAPRRSLAAEAAALARGTLPKPRHSGGPVVPPGMNLGEAVTHVIGHLTDVILAGVLNAADGDAPEPVHALRVAARRLRSALSIFRKAVDGSAFVAVSDGLKRLATVAGAARDWDVFLDGTARAIVAAMPDDRRIATMIEVGMRRRIAAYAALGTYLASAEFHALELGLIQLAALDSWRIHATEDQVAVLAKDTESYATPMFARRLDHMLSHGADVSALPVEELHVIRKAGKRLRYAAEFFAPLYGKRSARRFIERLSDLQEELGHLNDTAAAQSLMAALGNGADRQFAAGTVQGFVAARQGDSRRAIAQAWRKFRRQEPFWT